MALTPGTRLGPFEVLAQIGVGGMGEVYRATDINLKRAVAIKVLPASVAGDAERLARFQREAEVLAALNHPNIAAIYGLERSGATTALVMELVEGPTLADRITQGAIPLDEALPIAKQIAEALEAAHEQGIIHRDLKPANIKVRPDGTVKVLDFGLAKALGDDVGADLSNSPTLSLAATRAGAILGTAAYMSPEQAKGKPVDKRSDVWAFGCVLFEMLTGKRAFEGEDVSDTLAAVLRGEPNWSRLPADTPTAIRRLLRRCLQKDRGRRLQSAGDARIEIEEARSEPEASTVAGGSPVSSRRLVYAWVALALAFFLTTVGVTIRYLFEPAPDAPSVRFDVVPPEGVIVSGRVHLSPDGRNLAFVAASQSKSLIWVRPLDSAAAQPLPSTEGTEPGIFWSADSQSIGFFAEDKLKKVAASGGPSQVLCNLPAFGVGGAGLTYSGAWNADDVILFGGPARTGLRRVSAAGGQPTPVTELAQTEQFHRYPNFLPDGRHYLYVALDDGGIAAYVGTLDSNERHPLPGIASEVKYSPSGHVVFVRDGALMAQPFDVDRLELSGEAFPVADPFVAIGALTGPFSVSMTGGLAYRVGSTARNSQFAWFDRTGKQLAIVGPVGEYSQPDLSPDGRYVAFQRGNQPDIWVLDMERSVASPVTSDPDRDTSPVWSPDGRTIAFDSGRNGGRSLYERAFGVVGEDKLLLKTEGVRNMSDWSRDGRYLAYESGNDVWALPLPISGNQKSLRVTDTPFTEASPRISPDGRWIAYESNESRGQPDVYIQSFPQPGAKVQVSTKGGTQPNWRRDSKELFYIAPDFTLMAVSIKPAGASVELGAPSTLFQTRLTVGNRRDYWVSGDGRFLLSLPAAEQSATPITVILNWAAGLKK